MENTILHPLVVMISDLHIGDPNSPLEDFSKDADFEQLLLEVIPKQVGWPTSLIIAGDFIDFAQVLPNLGKHNIGDRFGSTENESVSKIDKVILGHPLVFNAIGEYLKKGGQILILPGNHDIDFHWPRVFETFQKAVGNFQSPQLCFIKAGKIDEQRIYIEHGNQYSFDNWFEHWENPIIVTPDGQNRLERPFGTLFMDLVYNEIENIYPFINKVYPHSKLAQIILHDLISGNFMPIKLIAKLSAFFILKGKYFMLGRMLGSETEEEDLIQNILTPEEVVERFFIDLGVDQTNRDFKMLMDETLKMVPRTELLENSFKESILPLPGLLGLNDQLGMEAHSNYLLTSGKIDIVAFGHTHLAIDGNKQPSWGINDPRRMFNTGSWMPIISLTDREHLLLKDLHNRTQTHNIHYLVIELNNSEKSPKGRLESLLF